ncbi:protein CLMP1 [Mercurialis annua]|uniref:protein CLMP1 n=1 Tax=Mercurialis annua TaxID=3986 RepID=UPI00215F1AB5|nr:protein CLMP1 [Mercurialis annua]
MASPASGRGASVSGEVPASRIEHGRPLPSVKHPPSSAATNSDGMAKVFPNSGDNGSNRNSTRIPNANGTADFKSSKILKKAHELKEHGNKKFQNKDYVGALEQYDNALRLIPKTHPDRAVFHSNRAACLMQMKPIDYDAVISECNMALQVQPRFVRALLRRARAFEATGKLEMAMQDIQLLLGVEPNHKDALDIAGRLRTVLGSRQEAQQDLHSRPSPAALGASAVHGAPISGLGPCLPARPVSKKVSTPLEASAVLAGNKLDKSPTNSVSENGPETKTHLPKLVSKPSTGSSKSTTVTNKDTQGEQPFSSSASLPVKVAVQWRPLKLVYDHDIRLSQMPVKCTFKELRDIVSKRFPSSKSVLIKYKDSDGDLVTLTCTAELRLAESSADSLLPRDPDTDKSDAIGMLRLHIVEVSPEQEPPLLEEEEEKPLDTEGTKEDESVSHSSLGDSVLESVDNEIDNAEKEAPKEKTGASEDPESREVEMDDWLFEFAQLFRTHVGIDPDAHLDLHELGMELCSEALEETVTSEEAQSLFDKAALKFQEVSALAFFNWGNVHMCAARKRIPLDESAGKEVMSAQLQVAYDWVKEKYSLAREKYEEALLIKPDFYEGLLALGQQQFEMAKLHWSFALAKKIDLSNWDSTETLKLFDSAEEKMKAATEMWEKLEEQRAKELKDPTAAKKEELLRRRKKQGSSEGESGNGEISPEEAAEQAAVMRSQIHLFWGNMLFERSQVECKLGMDGWKKNLDVAVERFGLAGASEADISMVLKNHCSNGEVVEGGEKKAENANTGDAGEAKKSKKMEKA